MPSVLKARFTFVDYMIGKSGWVRINLSDVADTVLRKAKNHNCFLTVQRFDEPSYRQERDGEPQELQWCGPYFDFDSEGEEDIARQDALKVVQFFLAMGIPRQYIRCWFSGRRGFHVIVDPEVFGIEPSTKLTYAIKLAALEIAESLKLKSFDSKVYSIRRLLRIPDSVHHTSGLYKIELTHTELADLSMDQIKGMAIAPRGAFFAKEDEEEIPRIDLACAWWSHFKNLHEQGESLHALAPRETIARPEGMVGAVDPPVCMKNLLSRSVLPQGNAGNRTVMVMAAFYKDAGVSCAETEDILSRWIVGVANIGDVGKPERAAAMARATTRYVYDNPGKYKFACKFILSIGTEKDKIPCKFSLCEWIRGAQQKTKEAVATTLARSAHADMQGERVTLPVRISGKMTSPYVVPKKIKITCPADQDICAGCGISKFAGTFEHTVGVQDPLVLEMVEVTQGQQRGAIRSRFGIPKACGAHRLHVDEQMNVEEVRMIPPAEEFGSAERREYVTRKGFYLGYPIDTNSSYDISGIPCREPRTQHATLVFDSATKKENDVEGFRMTPEIAKELQVFQCDDMDVARKFDEIHEDLEANVTHIWGRRLLSISYDFIYHSLRGMVFNGQWQKGWAEMIVVGDSASGKTTIVKAMRAHYQMGDMISGGTAKRTGLLYSHQEMGGSWLLVWGLLPLNDLGLVTIDEFSDLDPDEFSKMTDARSSGIIKVVGIISNETNARVRLIAITNPKLGKTISSYTCGCESLKELITGAEDIRRFDFALAVASGDVPPEILNRSERPIVTHRYTGKLCNLLLRWAWSRRPEHVQYTKEAVTTILQQAGAMAKAYASDRIPLVEGADQRTKLARLAGAVAARLFSSDEAGEQVIVKTEHVLYVVKHLTECYDHKHFRYNEWSRGIKSTSPDAAKAAIALAEIRKLDGWQSVIDTIRDASFWSSKDLEEMAEVDSEQARRLLTRMRFLSLIQKTKSGYSKTPLLVETIKLYDAMVSSGQIRETEEEAPVFPRPAEAAAVNFSGDSE